MHLYGFGEADCLTRQLLDPCASRQRFPLDLLSVALARLVFIRINMTRVSAPIVRIIMCGRRATSCPARGIIAVNLTQESPERGPFLAYQVDDVLDRQHGAEQAEVVLQELAE